MKNNNNSFVVRDCTLIQIATGIKAQSLKGLRDGIERVEAECIYYHFWGSRVAPSFEEKEYNNDFAEWVKGELNDDLLAERLSVIDPSDYEDIEELRQELIDIIDQRLDELEYVPMSKYDRQFHFIKSFIVVFDTYKRIKNPRQMCVEIPKMSIGSIFYHFIEARRKNKRKLDDFSAWLLSFGSEYRELVARIAEIDPFFMNLTEIRSELARAFREHIMEI